MERLMPASSGLKGLDDVLHGLKTGDNVVWQIENIDDYRFFASAFVNNALKESRKVIYIRFASHKPIIEKSDKIRTYNLDAFEGFETFSSEIHKIIKEEGDDAFYVFDCLSELINAWATDLMIGNFFMVTCPYLFELNTVAYFAIQRNYHSFKTVARIRETTQVLIDLYNIGNNYYIHPLKVWRRYSPTMFLPHQFNPPVFIPVTGSLEASRIFSSIYQKVPDSSGRSLDYWDRYFIEAEKLLEDNARSGGSSPDFTRKENDMLERLLRVMIAKEGKMLSLFRKYFTLSDLPEIKKHLVGTGYIGGKTAGMLLSRKMLETEKQLRWSEISEPHDSFFIGSDVFYSYIVQNGWWKIWMEHKTKEGYFSAGRILREKLLLGSFPDEIKEQFQQLIEYFGQSPIIIRSSSLLEDSFGNAFAGKYESLFEANQGTPDQRYLNFENAVRRIFVSTFNENALSYRLQRGLSEKDEQMALLVQRVSGFRRGKYFFPDIAGVGLSYNIFLWKDRMKPEAGIIRLVAGLGTRAVNRVENDYPRLAALDDPMARPYYEAEDIRKYSQHEVDLLDMEQNTFNTLPLSEVISELPEFSLDRLCSRDDTVRPADGSGAEVWIMDFNNLLSGTSFVPGMRAILKTLEEKYEYPVEVEFTGNFAGDGSLKINLLQCRPLQGRAGRSRVEIPENVPDSKILFKSKSYFIGGNISRELKRIVYVEPESYLALSIPDKYEVARLIGKINRKIIDREEMPVILIGPGRWGTSTPSMGVPVNFAEINRFSVMAEVSYQKGHILPELSFGTHFFCDLVETDIFYAALFPEKPEVFLNKDILEGGENILSSLIDGFEKYEKTVRVIEPSGKLILLSDIVSQQLICCFR